MLHFSQRGRKGRGRLETNKFIVEFKCRSLVLPGGLKELAKGPAFPVFIRDVSSCLEVHFVGMKL
jgi:hypothetical protein